MNVLNYRLRRHEPVEIQEKRFGYFPKTFQWRGKRYNVQTVERCWNATQNVPHLCFRVRCQDGTFELYQNVRDNTWQLAQIRA